jgi:glycosyltransferase involved in cell wall biosynthesis
MVKVSVIMPVFNGAVFLGEAIQSILEQTFTNYEFIIINDGSTDSSLDVIKSFNDPRIKLIINPQNLGIILSLNKGLAISQGEYIARMDCDDICYKDRLDKQVGFLDSHKNIGILACNVKIVDRSSKKTVYVKRPETNHQIKWRLLFDCPIMHPAVMFRKELVEKYGDYSSEYLHSEDYELWSRFSKYTEINQINEVLVILGKHDANIGSIYSKIQNNNQLAISYKNISHFLLENKVDRNSSEYKLLNDFIYHKPEFTHVTFLIFIYKIYENRYDLTRGDIEWIKNELSVQIIFLIRENKYIIIDYLRFLFNNKPEQNEIEKELIPLILKNVYLLTIQKIKKIRNGF